LATLPPPSVMMVSAQREANCWPRGEPPAWQALRRARRVQGPAAAEVLAVVVDRMDLGAVGELVVLRVEHHGVGLPRLPQPGHDVGELVGDVVALVVRIMLVAAVVLRRPVVAAGDAVPADPAFRHMVERIDQPGQQVGRVFANRQRWHQPEMLRLLRQVGHQHRRIELGRRGSVLQVGVVAALVGVGHVRGILDDHVVEAGPLHAFGEVDEQVGHHPAVEIGAGPRRPPGLGAVALGQEPGEVEGVLCHCPRISAKPLPSEGRNWHPHAKILGPILGS
jgi:hypothetical protein